ncbi:putative flavoprotein involved in K+ transport [Blastococcus colisei]|uniref:Putative flavoprotein involved in K+ transport n=1 Tax=Blastococcus colisei TaxID=1564162 RepID=A0A543PA13_9ACTN|nr:FAD-dependent oxidoreductase [Blastococcus colisei]TQN40927.1 putative flavoprotein involved in K+ transport [Blastococcus colisei]
MNTEPEIQVLVIGAGQAGLGTAYRLRREGVHDVLVVEAGEVAQSWRERWASLQLFTPRRFSSLPGRRFPPGPTRSPSRLEMADYLVSYATSLELPVRTRTPVRRLVRREHGFVAATPSGEIRARHVVVATGAFRRPRVPAAAGGLSPAVHQLHSSQYCTPDDVPPGPVLVVGGGNSAAQLAIELSDGHEVTVAAPTEPRFLPEDVLGVSSYWWLLVSGILNAGASTPVARFLRSRHEAILGRELKREVRAGRIRLAPHRVVAADGNRLRLADGSTEQPRTVLWCTGFEPDTAWIAIDGALADGGAPVHSKGASPVAGLHWMGLPWQTRVNSSLVDGVDRDARRTARRIRRRERQLPEGGGW